jgi:hypothetical protein
VRGPREYGRPRLWRHVELAYNRGDHVHCQLERDYRDHVQLEWNDHIRVHLEWDKRIELGWRRSSGHGVFLRRRMRHRLLCRWLLLRHGVHRCVRSVLGSFDRRPRGRRLQPRDGWERRSARHLRRDNSVELRHRRQVQRWRMSLLGVRNIVRCAVVLGRFGNHRSYV